LKNGGSSE